MDALLYKTIRYDYPATIPVSVSIMPAAVLHHGRELLSLKRAYPQFLGEWNPDFEHVSMPQSYRLGTFTDEWGCVWENVQEGLEAIVKQHPLSEDADVLSLAIPPNRDGRLPHGFLYLRLLDLCGFAYAMELFAREDEVLQTLVDKVLTYNLYQLEAVLPTARDMLYFGDDLGMQNGLAIGAERWRRVMKPCFAALYARVKAYNPELLVYMHTDGCIWEIIPDLKECGVDILNPQIRANGLANLVNTCRGKLPISLDLDRQLFPFATPAQIDDHVGECVQALYLPQGGLALQAELNYDLSIDTMAAVLEALEHHRHYH